MMIKQIFKMIWNQRRLNGWIWMELYLLPILKSSIGNERCLYKHTLYAVNKSLKEVAKMVKTPSPTTNIIHITHNKKIDLPLTISDILKSKKDFC